MSKYNIKNHGTINSVGDNNNITTNSYSQKIVTEFDKILLNLDNKTLHIINEDIAELKNELSNDDINSAISRIRKMGPWISDVAKNVGANLISKILI